MLTDRIVTPLFYRIMDKFFKPLIGESRESIILLFRIFIPAEVYSFKIRSCAPLAQKDPTEQSTAICPICHPRQDEIIRLAKQLQIAHI